jgi:hypothetical protein
LNTLEERAAAARVAIRQDPGIDRYELLSYVIWPTESVIEAVPRRSRSPRPDEVEHMAALRAAGLSDSKIARQVWWARASVTATLRRHEQERQPAGSL